MLNPMPAGWTRREHFAHYMHGVRCTFSLTVQIDVTALRKAVKENGIRAYPAQIYMLAATVNRYPEFRMAFSQEGAPGYWDVSHPSYTVLNPETKTFSNIWTCYDSSFAGFYAACLADMEKYRLAPGFAPKAGMPQNAFNISSLLWVNFTAFNLNVFGEGTYLAPIFTLGKYSEEGGKCLLPLALQLHHAACDGYHAGGFIEALRTMAADFEAWLF